MNKDDFVYHMIREFFGFITNIYVDGSSGVVYYGVHGLDGKYVGSFPAVEFMKSSRA